MDEKDAPTESREEAPPTEEPRPEAAVTDAPSEDAGDPLAMPEAAPAEEETAKKVPDESSLLVPIGSAPFDADDDETDYTFPEATLKDFAEEVPTDERKFCLERYADLKRIRMARMHCTACNKHLGLSASNVDRLRMHPLLRTLICDDCLDFYNSGEFLKGEDGSELYCRWCGQGGQVFCCSSCPTVFCQNCIKRNFGQSKIADIESIDEWNCFVCSPKALWCHRAALWAARRYCNLKNAFTLKTMSKVDLLKRQRKCQIDESVCCKKKNKPNQNQKPNQVQKSNQNQKPNQNQKLNQNQKPKTSSSSSETKTPSEPKPIVRKSNGSEQTKNKHPWMNSSSSLVKKISYESSQAILSNTKNLNTSIKKYSRKHQSMPIKNYTPFNGFMPISYSTGVQDCYSNIIPNDNLNLSLESLTQGLDMSSLNMQGDDLVCTPDFPLIEPVCEVTERDEEVTEVPLRNDDEVQCLTPLARIAPKPISALMPKAPQRPSESNIIQMTEKDVTINKVTGGLKFRVDPSTLSTSKMYQLPDGRIFAVNLNPKMPGGYSATIVNNAGSINSNVEPSSMPVVSRPGIVVKLPQRGPENVRKRKENSGVTTATPSKSMKLTTEQKIKKGPMSYKKSQDISKSPKPTPKNQAANSNSVEWYTYNLLDAVNLINYISTKLSKMNEIPTATLRNKSLLEMKDLHFSLDQVLKVSSQRLQQVRSNLNNEFKNWLKDKCSIELFSDDGDDDDDRVEITSDNRVDNRMDNRVIASLKKAPERAAPKPKTVAISEPIFIDENSNDSTPEIQQNEGENETSPRRESENDKSSCKNRSDEENDREEKVDDDKDLDESNSKSSDVGKNEEESRNDEEVDKRLEEVDKGVEEVDKSLEEVDKGAEEVEKSDKEVEEVDKGVEENGADESMDVDIEERINNFLSLNTNVSEVSENSNDAKKKDDSDVPNDTPIISDNDEDMESSTKKNNMADLLSDHESESNENIQHSFTERATNEEYVIP